MLHLWAASLALRLETARTLMSNGKARIFWIALAAVFGLFAGYAIARFDVLPTSRIERVAERLEYRLHLSKLPTRPESVAADLVSKQYRVNASKTDRELDTALLPFRLRGVSVNPPGAAMEAGGITMVGGRLLVMDRLGDFFQCTEKCEELTRVPLPGIPNNIREYASDPVSTLNERIFRAHSVRYSSSMGMLAVSHDVFDPDVRGTRLAVSVIDLDPTTLKAGGSWTTVFLTEPIPYGSNDQAGGALAWGNDGKLFLTVGDFKTGDFKSEAVKMPQDRNSAFGKAFEIDVHAQTHRLLSSGLRNPEGLVMTKSLGLVSVADGPQGGDRLDKIIDGGNYGWPTVTLGTDYHKYSYEGRQDGGRIDGYISPIFAWVPSIAPSEVIEVRDFDERWDGDLLVASMKAQRLFRLRLDGSRVIYSEPIFMDKRIRDLVVMKPGVLALWTDDAQVILMSVDDEKLETDKREPSSLSPVLVGQCLYCHHFGPTNQSDVAPSFTGLLGRPIASDGGFVYSAGLRKVGGNWTEDVLRRFLSDPAGFANGTPMPQMHLEPKELDEIVAEFERLGREASKVNPTP
jgi:cytochrome c2